MNVAIIDDEEDARYILRNALENIYGQHVLNFHEASSVNEGIKVLSRERLDIVFLDIQLQDGTGFDLLQNLGPISAKIIFVTAFDEFALRAFDFYAFAYLVKPFKQSVLKEVMDRLINGMEQQNPEHISMISDTLTVNQLEKIIIPEIDGFQVVQTENVLFLKSDNNYTEFFLENGNTICSSRTLKDYEKLLTPNGFFRIHRSYLINISKVQGYSSVDGGFVKMSSKLEIPIGRRKIAQFRKLFLG